tara:strand:- start:3330 stop:4193 length:864 start_codon:yes stop_codon:yes gene_type:complete
MKTAILIQTHDGYDFLWEGLFLSWKLNWNWEKFNFPLYLITETKQFLQSHPDCDFKTINVGDNLKGSENYSNKLIKSLLKLKKEGYTHVIYSQDDSWPLHRPDSLVIEKSLDFVENNKVDCFYMHEHKSHFPFTLTSKDIGNIEGHRIREFNPKSRFIYNHGNAIWDIDSLLYIQKADEAPYENELGGIHRIWEGNKKLKMYMINMPWYNQDLIHDKGKLKQSAKEIIWSLRFRYDWEFKKDSFTTFIANNGSLIPKHLHIDNKLVDLSAFLNSYDGGRHFSEKYKY